MDWSRAKTILIIAFIILNTFLLLTTLFTSSGGIFENDYTTYAKSFLASRDIVIKSEVPKISNQIKRLVYSTKEYDALYISKQVFGKEVPITTESNVYTMEDGIEKAIISENEVFIVDYFSKGKEYFRDDKRLEKELQKYLKKLGYKRSILVGGKTRDSESSKEYEYIVKYKKALVFDLKIVAKVDTEGMMTLTIPIKEVKEGNGKSEILSPYQILVMAKFPQGTQINDIEFGYKQISEGDLYGNPLWRFLLNDEKVMYYNAYTGEEFQP